MVHESFRDWYVEYSNTKSNELVIELAQNFPIFIDHLKGGKGLKLKKQWYLFAKYVPLDLFATSLGFKTKTFAKMIDVEYFTLGMCHNPTTTCYNFSQALGVNIRQFIQGLGDSFPEFYNVLGGWITSKNNFIQSFINGADIKSFIQGIRDINKFDLFIQNSAWNKIPITSGFIEGCGEDFSRIPMFHLKRIINSSNPAVFASELNEEQTVILGQNFDAVDMDMYNIGRGLKLRSFIRGLRNYSVLNNTYFLRGCNKQDLGRELKPFITDFSISINRNPEEFFKGCGNELVEFLHGLDDKFDTFIYSLKSSVVYEVYRRLVNQYHYYHLGQKQRQVLLRRLGIHPHLK
ncbi:hypothetical protein ACFLZN_02680 [Nanoarchaeota archaeon]